MTLKHIFVTNLAIGVLIKACTFIWLLRRPANSEGLIEIDFWNILPPMLIGALLILCSALALMGQDHRKHLLLRFDAAILLVASLGVLSVLLILPFDGAPQIYTWAWALVVGAAFVGYSAYVVARAFGRSVAKVRDLNEESGA